MSKQKKPDAAPVAVAEKPIAAALAERIDVERPDVYPEAMIARHRARYLWALGVLVARFNRAGKVLDAACGTGYGSHMLLGAAAKVVGMDCDDAALTHARGRFGGGLLAFRHADFRKALPAGGQEFDAVVTIETVEHVDEAAMERFLVECRRVIRPYGLLLLSTPEANAEKGLTSPFHVKEYRPMEMVAKVIAAGFVDVKTEALPEVPGFIFLTARRLP